jgi:hypothetical protein
MSEQREIALADLVPPDASEVNPFNDKQHPAEPAVLEVVLEDGEMHDQPVAVLCPGCTDILEEYPAGLPRRLGRVQHRCEDCETTLNRWALVVVNSAYQNLVAPAVCREIVTSYWETNLWSGIMTGETSPRTHEYSKQYSQQAEEFSWSWQVTCPLCHRDRSEITGELDYHHWRRDPDRGICLCRTCHNAISAKQRDTDLDWVAQQEGLRDKHDLQVTRLALRDQAIGRSDSLQELVERLCERYNVVQPQGEVYSLLSQTLTDEAILAEVNDTHLLAGLDAATPSPSLSL